MSKLEANKQDVVVDVKSKGEDKPVQDYRLTKKSAWGMFYVGLASIFGSLMTASVKYVSQTYKLSSPTITFTRSVFNLIINLVCCAIFKVNPIGPVKETRKYLWVLFRGLFGGIQITCYFFAFTKMTVGDATTLTFIAPVLTGIFAIFMLKEKWGAVNAVSVVLCFIGVLFTTKPTWLFPNAPNPIHPWDAFIAIMGSVSAALAYVAVRKAGPTVSVFVLINYALFFTLLINIYQGYVSPLHAFPWPKSTTPVMGWVLLVGISVLGSLAQFSINRGLQLEKAGPASSMRFLDIVFSHCWQILFFHEGDVYSYIGSILVSSCLIIIGLDKWCSIRKARLQYEANLSMKN